MPEHRTVDFSQYVCADRDDVVGGDPYDVLVKGGVVDLAEAQSVGDDGLAARPRVRDDVRRVQNGRSSRMKTGKTGRYRPGTTPWK
jgi:hypothetical protein